MNKLSYQFRFPKNDSVFRVNLQRVQAQGTSDMKFWALVIAFLFVCVHSQQLSQHELQELKDGYKATKIESRFGVSLSFESKVS